MCPARKPCTPVSFWALAPSATAAERVCRDSVRALDIPVFAVRGAPQAPVLAAEIVGVEGAAHVASDAVARDQVGKAAARTPVGYQVESHVNAIGVLPAFRLIKSNFRIIIESAVYDCNLKFNWLGRRVDRYHFDRGTVWRSAQVRLEYPRER